MSFRTVKFLGITALVAVVIRIPKRSCLNCHFLSCQYDDRAASLGSGSRWFIRSDVTEETFEHEETIMQGDPVLQCPLGFWEAVLIADYTDPSAPKPPRQRYSEICEEVRRKRRRVLKCGFLRYREKMSLQSGEKLYQEKKSVIKDKFARWVAIIGILLGVGSLIVALIGQ